MGRSRPVDTSDDGEQSEMMAHGAPLNPVSARKPALGLGAVKAEGVGAKLLVQEAFLGRDRDERTRSRQQDRLAQLQIPGPERHALPFESCDLELLRKHVGAHARGIVLPRARHRLAEDLHRKPGRIVALRHHPSHELLEAVLHLHSRVLLEGPVPSDRNEPVRPDDGLRLRCSVGDVVAEGFARVDNEDDVVLGRTLGEQRHLRLHLLVARVGVRRDPASNV